MRRQNNRRGDSRIVRFLRFMNRPLFLQLGSITYSFLHKLKENPNQRRNSMFLSKHEKKSAHPYAWLAIFSLAAAGVISIGKRGAELVSEKMVCLKDMVKSKTDML